MPRVCVSYLALAHEPVTDLKVVHDVVLDRRGEEAIKGLRTPAQLQPMPKTMRSGSVRADGHVPYRRRRRGQCHCSAFR